MTPLMARLAAVPTGTAATGTGQAGTGQAGPARTSPARTSTARTSTARTSTARTSPGRARARAGPAAAAIAAAGLLISACGSAAQPGTRAGSSAAPSGGAVTSQPASRSPASSSPGASSAQSSAPSASPGLAQCAASALKVTIGQSNGTAGSIDYPLQFTNVSASACTLYGYPGVSFVTGPSGAVIGGAAVRNPALAAELVTLAPGAMAHAPLRVTIAQNYPASACKPVTAHWLQVFPPGSYAPLYVSFTATTCTGSIPSGSILGIEVVVPGASGP